MNALDRYLTANGITSRDFAKEVGTSEATVSRLRRGLQPSTTRLIDKIVEKTSGAVQANDFMSETNRKLVAVAIREGEVAL